MKKLLSLIFILAVSMSLCACSSSGSSDGSDSSGGKASPELISLTEKDIDAIGEVTLSSESYQLISDARASYNGLNELSQKEVSNLATLDAAESTWDNLIEESGPDAMAKMEEEYDKIEDVTWYTHQIEPTYQDERTYVLPYFAKQGESVWLRVFFNYYADDWVFFETITVNVDGENYYPTWLSADAGRDNAYGVIWEWADISESPEIINMLWEIAGSEETVVRFEGDEYYDDFTIPQSDKDAMKDVLVAYEYMK